MPAQRGGQVCSSLCAQAEAAAGLMAQAPALPQQSSKAQQPTGSPLRGTLVLGASTGCLSFNPHSDSGRC